MCCIEQCQVNLGYKERLGITVSLAVTKCCTDQLVKGRVCVGHSLQMQSIVSGKSWQQALQVAVKEDTVFTVRKQRRNAVVQLTIWLLFSLKPYPIGEQCSWPQTSLETLLEIHL